MEKFKVSFSADDQQLKALGTKHASDTYADIEATFVLGSRWTDMDSVSAVWWNDFTRIATVLDSQGKCIVPHEVLERKGYVRVNLVGSVVENDELVTRLTSYSAEAVKVNEKIKLTGSETSEITPSQFEQFVAAVKTDADRAEQGASDAETYANNAETSADNALLYSQNAEGSAIRASGYALDAQGYAQNAETYASDAEDARDEILGMSANATTLPSGSDATASYSDGVLSLGIPRGDTGATGAKGDTGATPNLTIGTVETLEPTQDAYVTRRGTDDNPIFDFGIPKGDTGEVTMSQLSALLPTDTASGDIASFSDGTDLFPALSVKAQIEPIQSGSGTPSPDNVRPISGHTEVDTHRTGVNLFDKTTAVDGYIDDANGQLSGTAPYKSIDYIRVVGGNSYYIVSGQTSAMWGAWYDEDKNYIIGVTSYANQVITAPSNASHVRLTIKSSTTGNVDTFAVNYLSTATAYEPYQGTTYTTTLGRTVYGGTLDVVSGVLTVDRAIVTLDGTESGWSYNSATLGFIRTMDEMKSGNAQNGLSDKFATISNNGSFGVRFGGNNKILYFNHITDNISGVTDLESWKSWLADNPTQVCYPLATPQTYQLTPQEVKLLLGTNNIWSDGKVTLTYSADIQRYIEKKLGTRTTLTMSRPMVQTEETE